MVLKGHKCDVALRTAWKRTVIKFRNFITPLQLAVRKRPAPEPHAKPATEVKLTKADMRPWAQEKGMGNGLGRQGTRDVIGGDIAVETRSDRRLAGVIPKSGIVLQPWGEQRTLCTSAPAAGGQGFLGAPCDDKVTHRVFVSRPVRWTSRKDPPAAD